MIFFKYSIISANFILCNKCNTKGRRLLIHCNTAKLVQPCVNTIRNYSSSTYLLSTLNCIYLGKLITAVERISKCCALLVKKCCRYVDRHKIVSAILMRSMKLSIEEYALFRRLTNRKYYTFIERRKHDFLKIYSNICLRFMIHL